MAKRLSEDALAIAARYDEQQAAQAAQNDNLNAIYAASARPGTYYTQVRDDGTTFGLYKSAIVGGDELVVGKRYVLERPAPKSVEGFELGSSYIALGTGDTGEFSGEVIDHQFRTFIVGAGDLFLLSK